MGLLIVAAALWLAVHLGISGTPLRDALVRSLGEARFRGVFSLLALATLALLIFAFGRANTTPFWYTPPWLVAVEDAVMLLAFLLLAAALIKPRGPRAGAGDGPRGVQRITRHPIMAAIGLWSGLHMIANGDSTALVFFGTFLLTVLLGVPASDARLSRRDPERAAALFAATSRVPFLAILAGRNRLVLSEIGWIAPLVGLAAWAAVLHGHQWVLGVSALPVW